MGEYKNNQPTRRKNGNLSLGNGNGTLEKLQFLVSMLDFWGVPPKRCQYDLKGWLMGTPAPIHLAPLGGVPGRWWQLKDVFIFTPNLGEDEPNFDEHIFSDGLKPPSSKE